MSIKAKFVFAASLFQFFPLTIFVAYAFWDGVPTTTRWLYAFMIGGAVALFQFLLFLKSPKPYNRIILGTNLYLVLGGLSSIVGWVDMLELLNTLREVGVLICISIIGLITTIGSNSGFVGVEDAEKSKIQLYSVLLMIAAFAGTLVSFYLKGNYKLSAVLPILFLVYLNKILKAKLKGR